MAAESIRFGVDGIGVDTTFEIDQLRLGGVIHVGKQDGIHVFSSSPEPGSSPYKVVGITSRLPEGFRAVGLWRKVHVPNSLGSRVFAAARGAFTLEELNDRLRIAADDVPFDGLHDPRTIANSAVRRIEAVIDRLDVVAVLGLQPTGSELWLHYRGLVAYLLLTCFDLLGQNAGWIDFGAWLKSNSDQHRAERNAAVTTIERAGDPVATAEALHHAYNQLYSMRQGFRRFITEVLPDDARRRLMDSVAVERRTSPPLPGETNPPVDLGEAKRIDWLLAVRNRYTHQLSYVPGLHPEGVPPDMRSDDDWWWMGSEMGRTAIVDYSVRRWPTILDEVVRAGLIAYIKGLSR